MANDARLSTEAPHEARLRAALRPMAAQLPESGIMAVVNYGHDRPDLIPFWAGEGDLPAPAFICDAAVQARVTARHSTPINVASRLCGRPWPTMCSGIFRLLWTLNG